VYIHNGAQPGDPITLPDPGEGGQPRGQLGQWANGPMGTRRSAAASAGGVDVCEYPRLGLQPRRGYPSDISPAAAEHVMDGSAQRVSRASDTIEFFGVFGMPRLFLEFLSAYD